MTTILIVFIIVFSFWLINTLRKNSRNSETIIYNPKPISESPIREKISKPSVDFQKISEPSIDFRWLPSGEVIDIQGYTISAGMFYYGYGLKDKYGYQPESSLINPKLKANANANSVDTTIEEMGYWPNYSTISPACRGGYLNWLSQGRSQPNAYIGYVFLFFYGLERRLIVDDKSIDENERDEIIEEVLRLLELYGSNSSFYSYAQALLSLHWVLYGNRNEIPKYLTLENRRVSFPVQAQIGALINQGKPIIQLSI